jgi:hypothetical protein
MIPMVFSVPTFAFSSKTVAQNLSARLQSDELYRDEGMFGGISGIPE